MKDFNLIGVEFARAARINDMSISTGKPHILKSNGHWLAGHYLYGNPTYYMRVFPPHLRDAQAFTARLNRSQMWHVLRGDYGVR